MLRPGMKAIRTQSNFDKARMITVHSGRHSKVAIRIPFMELEQSESSETHLSSFSIYSVLGLKKRKSSWSQVSPCSFNPFKDLKNSVPSMPQGITFSVLIATVIHPFSVVVFMTAPIYTKNQSDTCESNAQRAHQVKTQGNSKRALKIIKITAHTNRTIGMVISISFMGLRKTRSSEARESTSFVFECTMIHLVSIVICFSGYLSMQIIYRYGLTKSGIGAREICPKISNS